MADIEEESKHPPSIRSKNLNDSVRHQEDDTDLLKSVTIDELGKLNRVEGTVITKGSATDFNILVCGAAGIGKSCFTQLFMKKFTIKDDS